MSPAEILKAIGDGGFSIIEFVIIFLLWRELIRSRRECEGKITSLQDTQMRNVSKIARLEAQTELLIAFKTHSTPEIVTVPQPSELLPALRQPPAKV